MPKSRHATAIFSPSSSLAMNFSRSSMGLHTFHGILRSPQKARLCNPCLRTELSPLSQEGHIGRQPNLRSRFLVVSRGLQLVCKFCSRGVLKSEDRLFC